jgi:hypothetical protein
MLPVRYEMNSYTLLTSSVFGSLRTLFGPATVLVDSVLEQTVLRHADRYLGGGGEGAAADTRR